MENISQNFFRIKIEGHQFKKAYLVYIIKLSSNEKGVFYYVGQTGDRNYLTARSAFQRLAAHFSTAGSSTENQIYREVASKILKIEGAELRQAFSPETKNKVATFLSNCDIEMFAHPIAEFSMLNNDTKAHKLNRELTEKIESELISYIRSEFGDEKILNKKFPKTGSEDEKYDPITLAIIENLNS